MKAIIRPDMSVALTLFALATAIVTGLTAARGFRYSANQISALVATSGCPSGA